MKAVFISLYQAFYDEVMEILDKNEIRGFTFSLYQKSVARPIMTGLIYIAVIIIGIFSLTKLPVDLFPHLVAPQWKEYRMREIFFGSCDGRIRGQTRLNRAVAFQAE